jgi:hypothetical protein
VDPLGILPNFGEGKNIHGLLLSEAVAKSKRTFYLWKKAGSSQSSDDFDPISPISRPRGYGGIAVVYKKTLSPSITQLPDGDHRIQVIEIITNDKSICLVNVKKQPVTAYPNLRLIGTK